jgi:CheY-like chemotaxis protein
MESSSQRASHPLVVLWTEDDENDRIMIDVALSRSGRAIKLVFVEDGEQAWAYISGTGAYADRDAHPPPDVLVTDLKMPRCNGFELVERVRSDQRFHKLPIFVFSASDLPSDRRAAQRIGVDGYVTKPTGFGLWTSTVVHVVEQAESCLRAA